MTALYLAGKISGGDIDAEFRKFMECAHELRLAGYTVINPVEINHDRPDWNTCMRRDIKALMDCDSICMLPDWIESKGARLERSIALDVGMKAVLYLDLLPEQTEKWCG